MRRKGFGININVEYINHLRFADDIILKAESREVLIIMLSDFDEDYQQVGIRMNMDKKKIISNDYVVPTPISLGNSALKVVHEYNYLFLTMGYAFRYPAVRRRVCGTPDRTTHQSGRIPTKPIDTLVAIVGRHGIACAYNHDDPPLDRMAPLRKAEGYCKAEESQH
ncbi:unnamed protein product [Euphydryas editha]|uniref:Reverse transcriptase domain-containing protein n=1 Tax=Euphydryas editha TaxID=104508 RepID=A0AAU9UYG0_EUPED|nr:unnamed protein product [Euphydryas editha]